MSLGFNIMNRAGVMNFMPRATRYEKPRNVLEVSSAKVGFTNGFLLKVPTLYAAGDIALLEMPAVAIVGSRGASPEGKRRAAKLARELVARGIIIMSGLAKGIDEAALSAAVECGGRTIAVIGTPVDKAYPAENAPLQEKIWKNDLLISPFAIGTRTNPGHFPERNRVMARLSRATVIIEAGETSGTLHQAVECVSLRKPLFIAKSVLENPDLKWPAKFKNEPNTYVLESTSDVVDRILG